MDKKSKNRKRHIKSLLHQGPEQFNQWRDRFPTVRVVLSNDELLGRNLDYFNFDSALLRKADISDSSLRHASLRGANLNEAVMVNSDLTGSNLKQARLANCDLGGAQLDGTNLYATIRDGWNLTGVKCSYCWITKDRDEFPEEPDLFKKGEFEASYGGKRYSITFPGGFEPVDLMALPFHAKKILEDFPNKKIILAGLSTTGEPTIDFQVFEENFEKSELQKHFNEIAGSVRNEVKSYLETQTMTNQSILQSQNLIIETMRLILETERTQKNENTVNNIYYGVQNLFQSHGKKNITLVGTFNFGDQDNIDALTKDLRKLQKMTDNIEKRLEIEKIGKYAERQEITKLKKALSASGRWLLDFSTNVGTDVASSAIKSVLGLE